MNAFLTKCACGNSTSRAYARTHAGKCKSCTTGEPRVERAFKCPDCGQNNLTAFQRAHRYHCDNCTHNVETTGGIYGY